uniref:Uncharacterized protein n=1 Tax=Arundo donax TaxID=35708 RepID=A0A0A9AG46_ARUDO
MTMLLWHGHPMLGLVRVQDLVLLVQTPRSNDQLLSVTCEAVIDPRGSSYICSNCGIVQANVLCIYIQGRSELLCITKD